MKHRRILVLALLLATGLLSGCQALVWTDWSKSVRPSPLDRKPPPPDLSSLGMKAPGGKDLTLRLTMDQSVAVALANNPQLRAAFEEIEKAKGAKMTAWSAVLPTAKLNLRYTHLDKISKFTVDMPPMPPIEVKTGPRDNYAAEVQIQQPLFLGGMGVAGIQLAALGGEYAELQIDAAGQKIAFLVKKTYLDALFVEASIEVLQKALENAQAHLEDVKRRLAQQVGTRFDVLRAEVKVANARASLLRGKNNRNLARTGLLRMLGLPQSTKLVLTDKLAYEPLKVSASASLEKALAGRPDLKSAGLALDMAQKKVNLTIGEIMPKAFAYFNYGWEKPSTKSFGSLDGDDYWNLGMIIDVPLFDGFSGLGKIRKAYSELRQARWAYEDLRQQVALDVEKAVLDLKNAAEFVDSQSQNIRQAEESLRLVKVGFGVGTNTQLDVLDVQTALTAARLNYIQAVYGYMAARFSLQQAEASLKLVWSKHR